ncbi:tetratricopeptide repeat-containing glycosyltransferase family 2 protein [Paenibacillus kobensis]|uniref:tetratricopeptide repeat-containing glycosyltransferase family 2 protein n=1 Tax=Paenibacillus kobensis TaxID=59841 RepID=UPI000FDB71A5|nr:glycosyltransferase family 2 protein [Paenibacillus kobensis]
MLLSLCMIVKNEERVLARCLDSVNALVDEIIIVDTGSTDRTKAIASRYTHHIYDYEWTNDFAAARNESIKHATGKWILVLDADEYIQPDQHEELRRLLQSRDARKPTGFMLQIMNILGSENGLNHLMESPGARLFSKTPGVHYVEPIHEQIRAANGAIPFENITFKIFHSGYTDEVATEKQKTKRNLSILENIKSSTKVREPYYCFVLGNEYVNGDNLSQAIKYYRKSYNRSKPTDAWYNHLIDRMITTFMKQNEYIEALKLVKAAQKKHIDVVDFYCLEGIILNHYGLYHEAKHCLERCLEIADQRERDNKPYWLIQTTYGRLVPHQLLADIARKSGDLHQLVHHTMKSLQYQDNNYTMLRILTHFLTLYETTDSIQALIEKLYPTDKPFNLFILFKTALACGNTELARLYYPQCIQHDLPITETDNLTYSLLTEQPRASLAGRSLEECPTDLLLVAAIYYQDPSLLQSIPNDKETIIHFAEEVIAILNSEGQPLENATTYAPLPLLHDVLLRLHLLDFNDICSVVVQNWADAETLNRLATSLLLIGRTSAAMEYLSVLLDNEALNAEGCKNVGQFLLMQGEVEDGIHLLTSALDLGDANEAIEIAGIAKSFGTNGSDPYRVLLDRYFKRFPDAKLLPFN